jgi:hypothetical protein
VAILIFVAILMLNFIFVAILVSTIFFFFSFFVSIYLFIYLFILSSFFFPPIFFPFPFSPSYPSGFTASSISIRAQVCDLNLVSTPLFLSAPLPVSPYASGRAMAASSSNPRATAPTTSSPAPPPLPFPYARLLSPTPARNLAGGGARGTPQRQRPGHDV